MEISKLYDQILGLVDSGWEIACVDLDEEEGEVVVRLKCDAHALAQAAGGKLHGYVSRRWRHLDSCQYKTIIEADVPRVRFADGLTKELEVAWAARFSRVTTLMEAHVIEVLRQARSHEAAAKLLGMSVGVLDRIMKRVVAIGLERREEDAVAHVGFDEKSMRRGHVYVSILNDITRGVVIDLVENRTKESAAKLWKCLSANQRDSVEAVAMDMWPAYMWGAKLYVPDADVVHDRFHVAKYLGTAVDTVRKGEHRQLLKVGDETLKGTKYHWLRRHDDLRSASADFKKVYRRALKTAKAWGYKEAFDQFWSYLSPTWAEKFFHAWYRSAVRTNMAPIKKVAKMLKKHLPGLLAYVKHRITNATAEGLNSKIQNLMANARGLPKFETLRIRVLFHCGGLDLRPA